MDLNDELFSPPDLQGLTEYRVLPSNIRLPQGDPDKFSSAGEATGRKIVDCTLDKFDVELSHDEKTVAVGFGKDVWLLDAAELCPRKEHRLPVAVEAVSLRRDGKQFIAGGSADAGMTALIAGGESDQHVHVFDAESGECIETCKGHHVRCRPSRQLFASASACLSAKKSHLFVVPQGPIRCLRYLPDESGCYASGSEDGTVRIWSA